MVEFVLESSWWVGAVGAILTVAAIQWWISSGRREALQIAIGTLLVTLVLVGVGYLIETEQESLRSMVYQTADHLQNNRNSEVVKAIYNHPTEQVLAAKRYIDEGKHTFDAASIKKLHSIDFSGPSSARRAIVKMNVYVEGRFDGYLVKVPRYVEVTLYRVGDRWLVYDFTHDQPLSGFKVDP
jgi:hypothetical protein